MEDQLLRSQAKIGIALKTTTKLSSKKEIEDAQKYIHELKNQIQALQLEIGTFGMLYVRNTFIPEHNLVYQNLSSAIQARNQKDSPPPNIDAFNMLE